MLQKNRGDAEIIFRDASHLAIMNQSLFLLLPQFPAPNQGPFLVASGTNVPPCTLAPAVKQCLKTRHVKTGIGRGKKKSTLNHTYF